MLTAPGNPIMAKAIAVNLDRRREQICREDRFEPNGRRRRALDLVDMGDNLCLF